MNSNRIKYSVNNVYINTFYQMPKFLVGNEEFEGLSYGAKFLYMLLKDRHELSLSNNWYDENNNIYLIYTRKNMQDMMNVSNKTITKFMDELKKYNLIEEVQLGQGKPNRIYLLAVTIENTKTCKKYISKDVKSTFLEGEKVHTNNTNINNIDFSENQSINQDELSVTKDDEIDEMDYEKIVSENIEYEELKKTCPSIVEDIYYLMVDTLYSSKPSYRINDDNVPTSRVKKRLLDLQSNHICYVIDCYGEAKAVTNVRAYLLTSLYNAPTTINSYYKNQSNQILRELQNKTN